MAAAAGEEKKPCCISHAFDRAALREPARLAVVHAVADGERRFVCGDLLSAVFFLSRRIAAALPRPSAVLRGEDGSSGCSDRCGGNAGATPRVIGVYVAAVLRCGEAFLPLDPSWPEERVRSAVSACNADLVVVLVSGSSGDDAVLKGSSCPVLRFDADIREWFADGEAGVGGDELAWPCKLERPR